MRTKKRNNLKELLLLGFVLALVVALHGVVQAQDTYEEARSKFYQIEELIKLIEKAKEAGFSEEDLRSMSLVDADKTINVMEYIERSKLKDKMKSERLDEFRKKKFLTVKDIFDELIRLEPDTLSELREELISE